VAKITNKWLVKTEDDGYLVSGALNGIDFDGKGKPYLFTKEEAKLIAEVTGGKMEEHIFPVPCDDCHIKDLCPVSGKLSNGAYCNRYVCLVDKETKAKWLVDCIKILTKDYNLTVGEALALSESFDDEHIKMNTPLEMIKEEYSNYDVRG
jgi:hypothetical protein